MLEIFVAFLLFVKVHSWFAGHIALGWTVFDYKNKQTLYNKRKIIKLSGKVVLQQTYLYKIHPFVTLTMDLLWSNYFTI